MEKEVIDLKTIYFRVEKECWENDESYYLTLPTKAYLTIEEAEQNLPENEMVVAWDEMHDRYSHDLQFWS